MISSETQTSRIAEHFVDPIRQRVAKSVIGQEEVVERILIALLTGGHLILEGMPGLAKTLLVNAVAKAIDLDFSRVQFTIDLLPSDIVGSEILDQKTHEFRTHKGPVFTNLLLADEINRAAPKVQSALLEAMQERQVTIGNDHFKLPTPFVVIATRNPVEQAGTFELPEAQLDRFMMCHRLDYPEHDVETEVLKRSLSLGLKEENGAAVPQSNFDLIEDDTGVDRSDLMNAMRAVQDVHVSDVFVEHCVHLVNRTRECNELDLGCSPRAGLALVQASRARACIHGRDHVLPEDLYALAEDVMLHRIRLTYEALARGRQGSQVLQELVDELV